MHTVKRVDTDVTIREVTLDNDYFVSLGSATDNGQKLSGFFKDDQVVKLYYNIGLSFGTRKYLYYFDNGQLIYVYEEENAFSLTQDGENLDYNRLEFVFGAGYFYQNGKLAQVNSKGRRKYSQDISQDFIASADELHTLLDPRFVAGKSVYTNSEFDFTFLYPSTWIKNESAFEGRGAKNDGMVFSVDFADPLREREIEVNACLSNRCVDWVNSIPTKTSCEPIFASFEIAHDGSCGELKSPRDIFVRVYKSSEPLPRWLISHYKVSHGELENYMPGRAVELSGVHGYLSSTGCCGGVDRAYVVKRGDYVYEVGSRDADVLLLEAYIKGFLFI